MDLSSKLVVQPQDSADFYELGKFSSRDISPFGIDIEIGFGSVEDILSWHCTGLSYKHILFGRSEFR